MKAKEQKYTKHFEVDANKQIITIFDDRWYYFKKLDKYAKSVTTVLQAYPKGYGYDQWLKTVGLNSKIIVDQAKEFGSAFHDTIEQFLLHNEVFWDDYNMEVWERFMLWYKWWKTTNFNYNETDVEKKMYSPSLDVAGTIDLLSKEDDKLIIYDWKSGNYIHDTAIIQQSVYSYMVKEQYNLDYYPKAYLVWIPRKKPNKKGYRIKEVKNIPHNIEIFKNTQAIYQETHKNEKPKVLEYPISLKKEIK